MHSSYKFLHIIYNVTDGQFLKRLSSDMK